MMINYEITSLCSLQLQSTLFSTAVFHKFLLKNPFKKHVIPSIVWIVLLFLIDIIYRFGCNSYKFFKFGKFVDHLFS